MSTVKKFTKINKIISLILLYSFIFTNVFAVQILLRRMREQNSVSALAKYTTDLTELARNNKLRVNDSFANETSRLMKTLNGGELRQTVILTRQAKIRNS